MYRLSVPPAHYPFFEIVQGYLNRAAEVIGLPDHVRLIQETIAPVIAGRTAVQFEL